MTLRNAALFALVGIGLWTILLTLDLIRSLSGLSRGIVAASATVTSLIHFLAALSLLVFFFVFHRSQS